jgi:chromosomal replication initiation ATPase DnaA
MIPQHTDLTDDQIRTMVAKHFGVKPDDLTCKQRHQWRVQLRAALVYTLRKQWHWDWERLSQLINRDRATVKHLVEMMTIQVNTQTNAIVVAMAQCLNSIVPIH